MSLLIFLLFIPCVWGSALVLEFPYRPHLYLANVTNVIGDDGLAYNRGCVVVPDSDPHLFHSVGQYITDGQTPHVFIPNAFCQIYWRDQDSTMVFTNDCGLVNSSEVGFKCTNTRISVYNYCHLWTEVSLIYAQLTSNNNPAVSECVVCTPTLAPIESGIITPNANVSRPVDSVYYNDRTAHKITTPELQTGDVIFITVHFHLKRWKYQRESRTVTLFSTNSSTTQLYHMCAPLEFTSNGHVVSITHNFTLNSTLVVTSLWFETYGFYDTDAFNIIIKLSKCAHPPPYLSLNNDCSVCYEYPVLAVQSPIPRGPQHKLSVSNLAAEVVGFNFIFNDQPPELLYVNEYKIATNNYKRFSIAVPTELNTSFVDNHLNSAFTLSVYLTTADGIVVPRVSVSAIFVECQLFLPIVTPTVTAYEIVVNLTRPELRYGIDAAALWHDLIEYTAPLAYYTPRANYTIPTANNSMLYFPSEYNITLPVAPDGLWILQTPLVNYTFVNGMCVNTSSNLITNKNMITFTTMTLNMATGCTAPVPTNPSWRLFQCAVPTPKNQSIIDPYYTNRAYDADENLWARRTLHTRTFSLENNTDEFIVLFIPKNYTTCKAAPNNIKEIILLQNYTNIGDDDIKITATQSPATFIANTSRTAYPVLGCNTGTDNYTMIVYDVAYMTDMQKAAIVVYYQVNEYDITHYPDIRHSVLAWETSDYPHCKFEPTQFATQYNIVNGVLIPQPLFSYTNTLMEPFTSMIGSYNTNFLSMVPYVPYDFMTDNTKRRTFTTFYLNIITLTDNFYGNLDNFFGDYSFNDGYIDVYDFPFLKTLNLANILLSNLFISVEVLTPIIDTSITAYVLYNSGNNGEMRVVTTPLIIPFRLEGSDYKIPKFLDAYVRLDGITRDPSDFVFPLNSDTKKNWALIHPQEYNSTLQHMLLFDIPYMPGFIEQLDYINDNVKTSYLYGQVKPGIFLLTYMERYIYENENQRFYTMNFIPTITDCVETIPAAPTIVVFPNFRLNYLNGSIQSHMCTNSPFTVYNPYYSIDFNSNFYTAIDRMTEWWLKWDTRYIYQQPPIVANQLNYYNVNNSPTYKEWKDTVFPFYSGFECLSGTFMSLVATTTYYMGQDNQIVWYTMCTFVPLPVNLALKNIYTPYVPINSGVGLDPLISPATGVGYCTYQQLFHTNSNDKYASVAIEYNDFCFLTYEQSNEHELKMICVDGNTFKEKASSVMINRRPPN